MTTQTRSRIFIVDDHPIVRAGLTLQLSMVPRFEVCGEAESESEALELIRTSHPDLVIVDIRLRQGHGLELIKRIKSMSSSIKILVVSGFDDGLYAERSIRAGALGYLNKQQSSEHLIKAVTTVLDGERFLSEDIARRLVDRIFDGNDSELTTVDCLSDRELQVFDLIGGGMTSRAIADRLRLSPHTIDTHRENIKRKLNVQSSAELTRAAVRWRMECE